MKVILTNPGRMIARLNSGEEIVTALVKFAKLKRFGGAEFTAIGAAAWAELAYFNRKRQQYIKKRFKEDLEILNIVGNIAWFNSQPIVHAHGVFGRKNFSIIGGHVIAVETSATCEIMLRFYNKMVNRKYNGQIGLNLLA
jgi:predicted DNA-binding protein with PD1-like motif